MKMKCAGCVSKSQPRSTNYDRFHNLPTLADFDIEEKHDNGENEEELVFYNDDDSYQTVIVVHKLRASDLCQILAMKNRVTKDFRWSIVENWIDIGLERTIEDHEDILQVYKQMESYPRAVTKKFIFRKDLKKYELFTNPRKFFPSEMVDLSGFPGITAENTTSPESLQGMVESGDDCLPMVGQVWVRDPNSLLWAKAYLLLKERKLYLSYKVQIIANFLRHWSHWGTEPLVCDNDAHSRNGEQQQFDWNQLRLFARIADSAVYATSNARKELKAPTEYGICIRTTTPSPAPVSTRNESRPRPRLRLNDVASDLGCIACETHKSRSCWMAAMRLAKYGKQLRENYRVFKSEENRREMESTSTSTGTSTSNSAISISISSLAAADYSRHAVPAESIRSRVATDWTGKVESDAHAIHTRQPWFHGQLSRDEATVVVNEHGHVDGVFLVRESTSNAGVYVLTFECGGKVIHSQIQPITDAARHTLCYTLDGGVTKFYDLLQLVEFYQLNAGCLPTRLTHHLVYTGNAARPPDQPPRQ